MQGVLARAVAEILVVARPLIRRPDVAHAHPQELIPGVAVMLDRGLVHRQEPERFVVPHPHRQRACVELVAVALLAQAQRLLRLLALDELPDLAADRPHHLQERLVGLRNVAPVELHDAQGFIASDYRKSERAVQIRFCRDLCALEIRSLCDIGKPHRSAVLPDGAYEPAGLRYGTRPALPAWRLVDTASGVRGKLRDFLDIAMPRLDTPQHLGRLIPLPISSASPAPSLRRQLGVSALSPDRDFPAPRAYASPRAPCPGGARTASAP